VLTRQNTSSDLHYLPKTLALAIPALCIGTQITVWTAFALSKSGHYLDFFCLYQAGYLLRTLRVSQFYALQPTGFAHPAYEALPFALLSFLPYWSCYFVWGLMNILVVGTILAALRNECGELRAVSPALPFALALAYFPVCHAIAQGQDSLVLVLLLTLAFVRIRNGGREFEAGLFLGLGIFRFQLILPILAFFFFRRSWKFLRGAIVSAGLMLGISVAITGVSGQLQYFRFLHLLSTSPDVNVAEMSNLRSVLNAAGIHSTVVLLTLSAAIFFVLIRISRKLDEPSYFLFSIAGTCLLTSYLFLHDLSLLLLPLLVVANRCMRFRNYFGLALAALVLVAPIATLFLAKGALWPCAIAPVLTMVAIRSSTGKELQVSENAAFEQLQATT
jgi:hypothetical protein